MKQTPNTLYVTKPKSYLFKEGNKTLFFIVGAGFIVFGVAKLVLKLIKIESLDNGGKVAETKAAKPASQVPPSPKISQQNFCSSCGARIHPMQNFCAKCGTRLR